MTTRRENYSTLVQDILRQLEADILSGDLMPGQHLDEQFLATHFGASRTPVREALQHLTASGLVEKRPCRGVVVVEIPVSRMVQMLEVMVSMEGLCARLAAERMTAEERENLRALHGDATQVVADKADAKTYYDVGMKFHDAIYSSARNPFLEETTRNLRAQLSAYRRHQFKQPSRIDASHEEHDAVLQAILEGDADLADKMMCRHLRIHGDKFVDYMTSLSADQLITEV